MIAKGDSAFLRDFDSRRTEVVSMMNIILNEQSLSVKGFDAKGAGRLIGRRCQKMIFTGLLILVA